MECKRCGCDLEEGKFKCLACGQFNVIPPEDDDAPAFMPLSDAPRTKANRLTAKKWWAGILGGGLVQRQCILLGGEPGGGKSTWALQLGEACSKETGKQALYIATEEAAQEIRDRAERIGVDPDCFATPLELQDAELACLDTPDEFCLVILDSLPDLIGDDPNEGVRVLHRLKHYSMDRDTTSLAIDHVNKGEELAGLNRLKHLVDTTMLIRNPDDSDERFMTVKKNRFGGGNKTIPLLMRTEDETNPGMLYPKEKPKTARKSVKTRKK